MAVLYAARNGDKDSAAQLILALGPNAHALAWRMVNNTAEAQDIVQESFLKLFKSARYEGRSSLSTFFYAIVSNACLDFLRKKHTEPLDEDEYELQSLSSDADPGCRPGPPAFGQTTSRPHAVAVAQTQPQATSGHQPLGVLRRQHS